MRPLFEIYVLILNLIFYKNKSQDTTRKRYTKQHASGFHGKGVFDIIAALTLMDEEGY